MSALSLSITAKRPMNRWDYDSIRPGGIGSVGDALGAFRVKQSSPDMDVAMIPFPNENDVKGAGSARVKDSNWGGRKHFKTSHGWYMQVSRLFFYYNFTSTTLAMFEFRMRSSIINLLTVGGPS